MDIVNEVILSLDPSSKAIGWAEITPQAELVDGGVIKPDVRSGASSLERDADMGVTLWEKVLDDKMPAVILIEWTTGKVGKRRNKGRGAGLPVYGTGVGWAGATCFWWKLHSPDRSTIQIIDILENDWTGGVKKRERQLAVIQEYPHYPPDLDPGGDLSDAIGMAVWWLRERRIRSWDFWTG